MTLYQARINLSPESLNDLKRDLKVDFFLWDTREGTFLSLCVHSHGHEKNNNE